MYEEGDYVILIRKSFRTRNGRIIYAAPGTAFRIRIHKSKYYSNPLGL